MRCIRLLLANRAWRRLVTLACLIAFVFVATAHASQHVQPLGEKLTYSAANATPTDGGNGDVSENDGICLLCALAIDALVTNNLASQSVPHERVETPLFALKPRALCAEYPPPIA